MSAKPTVISLFSGALGLDLGLEQAGFRVRAAVECNRFAVETIRSNRSDIELLDERLEDVSTRKILKAAGLRRGETTVVTAGPCCQAFSTAGKRGSMEDPRGSLFRQFLRVVREAQPKFFVMENVRGVLSAAVKHRPLKRRGPGYPPLTRDEELGSAFKAILRDILKLEYYTVFDVLNAADYGVPQTRERVFLVGSRDGRPFDMPQATHGREPGNGQQPWVTLEEALEGLEETERTYRQFCASKHKVLEHIPEGGNWRDLPPRLQKKAMGKAYDSWGGRVGFFRRLSWDRPAPELTTRPDSKATMFCHPTELRPLSVGEYARLQTFPDEWKFAGGLPQQYMQAGNAVPVLLGRAIGESLRTALRSRRSLDFPGVVISAKDETLQRLSGRPRTVLNPKRMRRFTGDKTTRKWLGQKNHRAGILRYLALRSDVDEIAASMNGS